MQHAADQGYSLLEVLMATTILAVGLLAIFCLTRSAHHRSLDASDLAAVELAAETMLNELLARQSPIEPIPLRSIDGVRNWKLEVKLYESPRPDLAAIFINAQKFTPQGDVPVGISFQLVRWVPKVRCEVRDFEGGNREAGFVSEFDDLF